MPCCLRVVDLRVFRSEALQRVDESRPDDAAWALRRAFDVVLAASAGVAAADRTSAPAAVVAVAASPSTLSAAPPPRLLLGASVPWGNWALVNDGVMGGRSASTVRLLPGDPAALRFEGTVSTANYGGFASCRVAWPAAARVALARATALRLAFRGSGHDVQVRVFPDDAFESAYTYQADVANLASGGDVTVVTVPAAAFVATFRGQRVAAPPLVLEHSSGLGLMVTKAARIGAFQVDLLWAAAAQD